MNGNNKTSCSDKVINCEPGWERNEFDARVGRNENRVDEPTAKVDKDKINLLVCSVSLK